MSLNLIKYNNQLLRFNNANCRIIIASTAEEVLMDGNTVSWYDASTAYITMDASNYITKWDDRSGNNRFVSIDNTLKDVSYNSLTNSISFSANGRLNGANYSLQNEPIRLYAVLKHNSFANETMIYLGQSLTIGQLSGNSMRIYDQAGLNEKAYGTIIPLNSWNIYTITINGDNTNLMIDASTKTSTYVAGTITSPMDGILLGTVDIAIKELIIRKTLDNINNDAIIYNYLAEKYFSEPTFILLDGNTTAWYSAEDQYITMDSSYLVSQWNDKSGNGYNIAQATDANKPEFDYLNGVLFSNVAKLKNYDISTHSGFEIYMVFRQNSWKSGDSFFSFANGGAYSSQYPASARIRIGGSADFYSEYSDQELNFWNIAKLKFNGTSSSIQIDTNPTVTGSIGTITPSTEGWLGSDTDSADFNIKELIYRDIIDTSVHEQEIYDYLTDKYNLAPAFLTNDGSTFGWWHNDTSANMSFSAGEISQWNDMSGKGNHLTPQAGAEGVWTADGVLLNKSIYQVNPLILYTPISIYVVLKENEYADGDGLFRFTYGSTFGVFQHTPSPTISMTGGGNTISAFSTQGNFDMYHAVWNGVNSKFQYNNTIYAGTTGDVSSAFFQIVCGNDAANVIVKEIILRNAVDNSVNETRVHNYLTDKYNLAPAFLTKDGSTWAWYRADKENTFTKNASNYLTAWADSLGSDRTLSYYSSVATSTPLWNSSEGVYFDGVDDELRTASETWNLPVSFYVVVNVSSWQSSDRIIAGRDTQTTTIRQTGSTSPDIDLMSSTPTATNSGCLLNQWHILRAIFNGANSYLQVDTKTATTGNSGTANPNGLSLGCAPNHLNFINATYKEIITRSGVDNSINQLRIYNYLANKYDIFIAQYQTVYNSFTTKPDASMASAQNTLVKSLVDNGFWDRMDLFYIFANNASDNALVNWKNPGTYNADNPTATEFTNYQGFTGDNISTYISTNFDLSINTVNYKKDDGAILIWQNIDTSDNGPSIGCTANSMYTSFMVDESGIVVRMNSATTGYNFNPYTGGASGFWTLTRNTSDLIHVFKNDTSIFSTNLASTGIPPSELRVLSYSGTSFADQQASLVAVMNHVSITDASILYSIFNRYITAIGPRSYSEEYQAVYSAMTSKPDVSIAKAQNTLVKSLVDNGYWDRMDLLYILANNASDNAKINWINPGTYDCSEQRAANGTLSFISYEGFTGDGSCYLDSGWDPSNNGVNYTKDSATIGVYVRSSESPNNSIIGRSQETHDYYLLPSYTSVNFYGRINSGAPSCVGAQADPRGLTTLTRTSSTNVDAYWGNALIANSSTASTGLSNEDLWMFRTYISLYSKNQLSLSYVMNGITATDASLIYQSFQTYMTAIGKQV